MTEPVASARREPVPSGPASPCSSSTTRPLIGEAVRRMLLPEAGWRFRYVSDPRQALAAAKEFQPTVILSDLVMPQMDGLELVRQLPRRPRHGEDPADRALVEGGAGDEGRGVPAGRQRLPRQAPRPHRARRPPALPHRGLRRPCSSATRPTPDAPRGRRAGRALRRVAAARPAHGARRARGGGSSRRASLGGDAFGYHWLDDDHFVVYLLDVSGHGVGAALLGVSVLNVLRARSLPGTDFRDPGAGARRASAARSRWSRRAASSSRSGTASTGPPRASSAGRAAGIRRRCSSRPSSPAPTALDSHGAHARDRSTGLAYETLLDGRARRGARMLLYSDGLYEIRKADGSAYDYDEFVADMASAAAGAAAAPLEAGLARAERLCAGPRLRRRRLRPRADPSLSGRRPDGSTPPVRRHAAAGAAPAASCEDDARMARATAAPTAIAPKARAFSAGLRPTSKICARDASSRRIPRAASSPRGRAS